MIEIAYFQKNVRKEKRVLLTNSLIEMLTDIVF